MRNQTKNLHRYFLILTININSRDGGHMRPMEEEYEGIKKFVTGDSIIKKELLKFIRPVPNSTYNINDSKGCGLDSVI